MKLKVRVIPRAKKERIEKLEWRLDAILVELRGCEDPELEDELNAELQQLMEQHTAALEEIENAGGLATRGR